MHVTVSNRQRSLKLRATALRRLVRNLMAAGGAGSATPPWERVTLCLVDNAGMRAVHAACYGEDAPTDVIATAYAALPGEGDGMEAEIVVNAERAAAEGAARPRARDGRPWGAAGELALYIAHGCDHLHGGRDATPAGRVRMRRRELRWLLRTAVLRRTLLSGRAPTTRLRRRVRA
jgi:ssRNA-specific RNase YbeY (16S rRNA maturation enzyme)